MTVTRYGSDGSSRAEQPGTAVHRCLAYSSIKRRAEVASSGAKSLAFAASTHPLEPELATL